MTGPGWRDVQQAIADAEERILRAIGVVNERMDDQDDRLDAAEKRIDDTENGLGFFTDREEGIKLVLRTIIAAVFVLSAVLAIAKGLGLI